MKLNFNVKIIDAYLSRQWVKFLILTHFNNKMFINFTAFGNVFSLFVSFFFRVWSQGLSWDVPHVSGPRFLSWSQVHSWGTSWPLVTGSFLISISRSFAAGRGILWPLISGNFWGMEYPYPCPGQDGMHRSFLVTTRTGNPARHASYGHAGGLSFFKNMFVLSMKFKVVISYSKINLGTLF